MRPKIFVLFIHCFKELTDCGDSFNQHHTRTVPKLEKQSNQSLKCWRRRTKTLIWDLILPCSRSTDNKWGSNWVFMGLLHLNKLCITHLWHLTHRLSQGDGCFLKNKPPPRPVFCYVTVVKQALRTQRNSCVMWNWVTVFTLIYSTGAGETLQLEPKESFFTAWWCIADPLWDRSAERDINRLLLE